MTGDIGKEGNKNRGEGTIAEGLMEIRGALGENAEAVLGQITEGEILSLEREDFISAAGYNARMDKPDGHLYTVELPEGGKLIVVHCKQSDNPFDLMPGGIDMRRWEAYAYLYDTGSITAIEPDGRKSVFSGEPGGNPEDLLRYLKSEPMLGRTYLTGKKFIRPSFYKQTSTP